MKKIFVLVIMLLLVFNFFGCKKNDETEVKMIYPSGAPALSLVDILDDNSLNLKSEMVSGADSLAAAFTSKSHDIIIAPFNLGVKLYNTKSDYGYLYCATITMGNTYLISNTDLTFDVNNLNNFKLYAFGEGTINEFLINYVLNKNNLNIDINYLSSTEETKNAYLLSKKSNEAYLVAEPYLSVILREKSETKVIDLQNIYHSNSNYNYIQAGIFIKKEFINNNKVYVKNFLNKLEKSIDSYSKNETNAINKAINLNIFKNAEVLKQAIKRLNLKYEKGINSKDSINYLCQEMIDLNLGKLIGNKLVDESFFYN